MRLLLVRVVRPLFLAFVILSCSPERAVTPTLTPGGVGADVSVAAATSTSTVVISQVYGGGGNAGATLRNDFIEVFNRSTETLSLVGWSVQYASSTGIFSQKTDLTGSITAGGYLLVQEAAGTGGTVALPAPDATGAIAMAAGSGKVALVRNTTLLNCGSIAVPCAAALQANIADLVGYGTAATFFEGTGPTATLTNTTAALRKDAGCLDTDNNPTDFATGAPAPRNSAITGTPCVEVGPVTTVTVSPAGATIFLGSTKQFTAVGADENGRSSPTTFTWTSSDPSVVVFNDPTSGLASAPGGQGPATITATSANGVPGSTTVFATEPGGAASVSISVNTPRQAPVGYTKPAFPTVRDADNAVISPPPTLVWSSSDENIATVDQLGYITGVAPGPVTIKATAPNGVFGTTNFTVIPGDAPTTAIYRNHIEFGTPTDDTPGDEHILVRRQSVSSYNRARGGPNWVSWDINASHFGDAPRCDCFSADQALPSDFYHVVDFDYRNGGYDRGHIVQSESRTTTDQENASTFLLTNILPQGAENNQGPWSRFENYLNDRARGVGESPKEIYVIAGGLYGPNPGTLKDEGKVAIPDYTWKVAVIVPAGKGLADVHSAGDIEVIAIEMPNLTTPGVPASSVGIRNIPWETYIKTVDEIEAQTGYDVLSNLPDQIEILVEANDQPPVAKWAGETAGAEGSALTFDASGSTDPDAGDALTYLWEFGDGTTATGVSASHTFADNGSYNVVLTVRDRAGAADVASNFVTVSNVAPTAIFHTDGPVSEGSSFNLSISGANDVSSTDRTAGFTYRFDCGFGFGPWGASPSAVCPAGDNPGYNTHAEIRDKDNGVSAYDAVSVVTNVNPSVVLAAGPTINSGGTYALAGGFADPGQADAPWAYAINWGNGSTSGSTSTQGAIASSRQYLAAGSYTISLAVTDKDGGSGAASTTLRVNRIATTMSVNPNRINIKDRGPGQVIVAILGNAAINGRAINVQSIRIGNTPIDSRVVKSVAWDLNRDGFTDLVVHFDRAALVRDGQLAPGTTQLTLRADMTDGRQIEARGAVTVYSKDGKGGHNGKDDDGRDGHDGRNGRDGKN